MTFKLRFCGGGEIRTLETLSSLPPFQGGGINHYPTPPLQNKSTHFRVPIYSNTSFIAPPEAWRNRASSQRSSTPLHRQEEIQG